MKRFKLLNILILACLILTGCNDCDYKVASGVDKDTVPVVRISDNDKNEESDESELANEEEEIVFGEITSPAKYPDSNTAFLQPMLQNPQKNSVIVQWFTEGETKDNNLLLYYDRLSDEPDVCIEAKSYKLSRLRGGVTENDCNDPSKKCDIWKHVAVAKNLPEYHGLDSERIQYRVCSEGEFSERYLLQASPAKGTPTKILLTSDFQIKNMCAANIQKVHDTVGHIDAVLFAGDIVDVSDRCYDWFYADNALFRTMTGTASDEIEGVTYKGAPIFQEAPIYTAIGNHDVMGVYDEKTDLSVQFNYPSTREHAIENYEAEYGTDSVKEGKEYNAYIRDHSFNTITYEEMFELPQSLDGGKRYYAASFGDVRIMSLELARVWRLVSLGNTVGKFSELPENDEFDSIYGYGDFIFESVKEGSPQYKFMSEELLSDEYQNAKYKIAMFHSEAHSLGDNQIPAFTDPVQSVVTDPVTGMKMTVYDYPIDKDYINTIVEPMLEKAGTNLLFEGHSHLWNRFKTEKGMNVLESSNVGNNYGGFIDADHKRSAYPSAIDDSSQYSSVRDAFNADNYVLYGDPYGLEPIMPSICNLPEKRPYLASNEITAFSVIDTKNGVVDSYYFDTTKPESEVVHFDSFDI